ENFMIVEDETFVNPWGFVPAITNSNLLDSTLSYYISPVDAVMDLADNYLTNTSVKNIYGFLHGYPIFWAYVEPCRTCDGTGLYEGNTCTTCGGDKHTFTKDVSDVIKLKPPKGTDEPVLAPDVAGYVEPSTATAPEMRTDLDWLWGLMHFTMWGTARQDKATNETATAAFIDVQPVNDRLNKFADAFEQTEKLMIDIIGKFYIRKNYQGVSVNYGRRFLVEPPDVIWKKYETAKKIGVSKAALNYLLIQFYQAEFKDDAKSMMVASKGVKHEPFIHKTDEEINKLPISDEDKLAKFYFNEWWIRLKQMDIITSDDDKLDKEFEKFLTNKKLENGQET
ncbi:MAG: zinc finger-like domain-containing protein, partial [Candidatus Heimdallarchaeota archaeon]|nr:zinc finger-like domain-containing protein [Candidatus Heimdallarchaeota archaeon]